VGGVAGFGIEGGGGVVLLCCLGGGGGGGGAFCSTCVPTFYHS